MKQDKYSKDTQLRQNWKIEKTSIMTASDSDCSDLNKSQERDTINEQSSNKIIKEKR